MSVITGIKGIRAHMEEQEAAHSNNDRVKVTWAKVPDKGAIKVRFLQELDADATNYSKKNGTFESAVEHTAGANWRRKAVCSMEAEGVCYACEKAAQEPKAGWGQKSRFYINVLVDNGQDEPFVAVLSQSFSKQSIVPALVEQAEEMETITDKWFKIKKSGTGKDTYYTLTPLRELDEDQPGVEEFELFDIKKDALISVPYERQAAHYHKGEVASDDSQPAATETKPNNEW